MITKKNITVLFVTAATLTGCQDNVTTTVGHGKLNQAICEIAAADLPFAPSEALATDFLAALGFNSPPTILADSKAGAQMYRQGQNAVIFWADKKSMEYIHPDFAKGQLDSNVPAPNATDVGKWATAVVAQLDAKKLLTKTEVDVSAGTLATYAGQMYAPTANGYAIQGPYYLGSKLRIPRQFQGVEIDGEDLQLGFSPVGGLRHARLTWITSIGTASPCKSELKSGDDARLELEKSLMVPLAQGDTVKERRRQLVFTGNGPGVHQLKWRIDYTIHRQRGVVEMVRSFYTSAAL